MRIIYLIIFVGFVSINTSIAQSVGIGTATPDASAIFEVKSNTAGILIPRMTIEERLAINFPATGLLVYQTNGTSGFYYFKETEGWVALNPSLTGFANTSLSNLTTPVAINMELNPGNNGMLSVGNISFQWKDLYLKNDIYMNGNPCISIKGDYNMFSGTKAGNSITTGTNNAAFGALALFSNSTGGYNTATGSLAMYYNGSGTHNSATGYSALKDNTWGYSNTANGAFALSYNNSGFQNTATGLSALLYNTSGGNNVATGANALLSNTIGNHNVATGTGSLFANSIGQQNSAFGHSALSKNTIGNYNTGIGSNSLYNCQTTSFNTAVGYEAGYFNSSNSTFIGANARCATDLTNVTVLGFEAYGASSNSVTIGNAEVTSIGGYAGWTTFPSDRRFKTNINDDVPGLAFIIKLRPVTYNVDVEGIENAIQRNLDAAIVTNDIKTVVGSSKIFISSEQTGAKQEKSKIKVTGFIAQEVEEVANELQYEFSGLEKPKDDRGFYGIRYAEFVVPLVKAVQELNEKVSDLEKENQFLKTREHVNGNDLQSVLIKQQAQIQNQQQQIVKLNALLLEIQNKLVSPPSK